VKPAILGHGEFTGFNATVTQLFGKWRKKNTPLSFTKGGHPKELIEAIAEDLLATFRAAPLLDAYDVFQHLMDYWAATVQDDCYLIAEDGWHEAAQPQLIVEDKYRKSKVRPDFTLDKRKYLAELIPPVLIIQRWHAEDQAVIEELEASVAGLQQQLEEMAEEHGGEDGLLFEAQNERGKLTKASVKARLRETEY
jgi:type I restriction enzyme M protein